MTNIIKCVLMDKNTNPIIKHDFSWFRCGSVYQDPKSQLYIIEISFNTQFISVDDGRIYENVFQDENENSMKCLLIDPRNTKIYNVFNDILEFSENDVITLYEELIFTINNKYGYHGIAISHSNSTNHNNHTNHNRDHVCTTSVSGMCNKDLGNKCDTIQTCLCTHSIFYILNRPDIIIPISDDKYSTCHLIKYSKLNYHTIKNKLPEFPSPEQIDNDIHKHGLAGVCHNIYNILSQYK